MFLEQKTAFLKRIKIRVINTPYPLLVNRPNNICTHSIHAYKMLSNLYLAKQKALF
jgi:hypothetical protein